MGFQQGEPDALSHPYTPVTIAPVPRNLVRCILVMPSNLYNASYQQSIRSSDILFASLHDHPFLAIPYAPNIDDMTPIHGFSAAPFGLRTRSLGSGGSLGAVEAVRTSAWGFDLPATMVVNTERLFEKVDGTCGNGEKATSMITRG